MMDHQEIVNKLYAVAMDGASNDAKVRSVSEILELSTRSIQGSIPSKIVQNRIIRSLAEESFFYWTNELEAAKELGNKQDQRNAEIKQAEIKKLLDKVR